MVEQISHVGDHFSLNSTMDALNDFRPPQRTFDPNGSWNNFYRVLSLAGERSGHAGDLGIRRSATRDQEAVLEINYRKFLPGGHRQLIVAKMECSIDSLATPQGWKSESEIVSPSGERLRHTRLEQRGAVKKGELEIVSGETVRRIKVPAAYTCNWALYDAVQRLPRQDTRPLQFTLFDHFDQVKGNHTLSFRKTAVVELGGQASKLHAYEQLGEGVVPLVYWTDDRGQLLFVISGIEAYVLESEKP